LHENLIKREVGEAARTIWRPRDQGTIAKHWQLGYAPDEWDAFGSWARARGFEIRDLIASGLAKTRDDAEKAQSRGQAPYDRFRRAIMFPI